jgi:uncharacterized membrane protein
VIEVTLFSREDCHPCEQARQELLRLQDELPLRLLIFDVDRDPKLKEAYGYDIPVVQAGPFTLKAHFTSQELRVTICAALDRERHIKMVEASPKLREVQAGGTWTSADGISRWFSRYYMLIFNLVVLFYLGGSFLAPVLTKMGLRGPANVIYKGYGLLCHQLAYRSVYLFGDQWVYPRAEAGLIGVNTFFQASGLSEGSGASNTLKARAFIGNEEMGYKVALCQRDIAIYLGILLFGILFSLSHFRLPPLQWYIWIMIGITPIAVDGLSQLLSQPPLSFWAFRESTPMLRTLTGFLFGFSTAWFGYPVVEESMGELRTMYQKKWERTHPAL